MTSWILGLLFLFLIIVMVVYWYRKYKRPSELESYALSHAKQKDMTKSAGCSLSSPSISVTSISQTSITVDVSATGEEGALNGVQIEWVGPFSGILPDTSALTTSKMCSVILPYPSTSLLSGQTVTVTIGAVTNSGAIFDTSLCQPTSTCSTSQVGSCSSALLCNTQYAIRATALGGLRTSCQTSAPSGWVLATTGLCGGTGGGGSSSSGSSGSESSDTEEDCKPGEKPCTRMDQFWRHYEGQWPSNMQMIVLGSTQYTKQQALQILRTENRRFKNNALIALAKELITALLNVANKVEPGNAVGSAIAQAHTLIGSRVIPPLGSGQLSKNAVQAVFMTLRRFNKGRIGPGRCKRRRRSHKDSTAVPHSLVLEN